MLLNKETKPVMRLFTAICLCTDDGACMNYKSHVGKFLPTPALEQT